MTHREFIRSLAGGTLLALVVAATAPAQAQGVLGRVRDRARQALAGNQNANQAATCASSDQSRASAAEVTDDVVARYLRTLDARSAEVRRIARENTPEGRYYARVLLHDSLARRHAAFQRHYGPDWERYQRLRSAPPSTDANVMMRNMQAANQVEQDIDENRVRVAEVEWEGQEDANKRIDVVAMDGGGFDVCSWRAIGEVIPQVVAVVCNDRVEGREERAASDVLVPLGRPDGLHPAELRAIRAHALELARGLNVDCPTDAEVAAIRREKAAQDSLRRAQDAWTACRERYMPAGGGMPTSSVPPDSLRVWQEQVEAAQRRGDQNTVLAIGMKLSAAMMPGMMQQAGAMQQAQQQCGPMPGTQPPK